MNNVTPIQGSVWTFEDYTERRCMLSDVGHERYDPGYAKRVAQRHTGAAIDALVSAVKQDDDLAAKVKAAQMLLDRGWGKAEQTVSMDSKSEVVVRFDWLSKERHEAMTNGYRPAEVIENEATPKEKEPWRPSKPDVVLDAEIKQFVEAGKPLGKPKP